MNIVLVIFDSLRKDCVRLYGTPPWGEVKTPHLDALAAESLVFDRAYPESLPTLPTRRAIYTGRRVYPFHNADFRLKGDFVGSPGWGPIPEDQDTLAELLRRAGYRTGLIADVYHMFKPSKNYTRGFDQWMFLRGQETDPYRSGPEPTQQEIDQFVPRELQTAPVLRFIRQCLKNMHGRSKEEDYFNARVFIESARWLEQNRDADKFFLVVECFDPHEPWFVPEHYRRMYGGTDGQQQVVSRYGEPFATGDPRMTERLLSLTHVNYSGLVTMCDRWFGHFYETVKNMGLLKNTLLIVTSDHGHSIGDKGYVGKRGYPSDPSVFDVPLLVRDPGGKGAGRRSEIFVQHQDIAAEILRCAGVAPQESIDGRLFMEAALTGGGARDHATTGWGTGVTVVTDRWCMNCKVDGTGPFLYDLTAQSPYESNVADDRPEVFRELLDVAVADAVGGFPDYLLELSRAEADAPGCSDLAARAV